MTRYHKQQAEIRYEIDNYVCQKCGKPAIMLAHRIINSKTNLRLYTEKVVNNNINLVPVCSLECNSFYAISDVSGRKKVLMIGIIRGHEKDRLTSEKINRILGVEV